MQVRNSTKPARGHRSAAIVRGVASSVLLVLALAAELSAQTATVRGFVSDKSSGEPLQAVNVAVTGPENELRGAVTNGDGLFAITSLSPGRWILRASFVGFLTVTDTLNLVAEERRVLELSLSPDESLLGELVVESERQGGAAQLTAGVQTVKAKDIDLVPSIDVSGDLASYLTTLPGIVTVGDRGGQLFVRGGEPAHNMVLMDGIYVFQPFHMLGFYSAFPSDVINRADIYAAGYGAPFTGRVSSVIDVHSRNGNKRRFQGAVSLAPFVSSVQLEGPLVRDRVSFIASWRRSVIQQVAQRYISQELPFNFGDAFGKLHWNINKNHKLSVSALVTDDEGSLGDNSEDRLFDALSYENRGLGVRYVFVPERIPFVGEIVISGSQLNSRLGPREEPIRRTKLTSLNYAVNLTNFIGTTEWHWGFFWRAPEIESLVRGLFQNVDFGFGRRHKAGLYIEPDFYITDNLHVRLGLIGQLFPGQDDPSFIEPRLRILYALGPHEFSATAGTYHQEIVGLNDRRDATNAYTSWRSAPNTDLTSAVHYMIGYRSSPVDWLEVALEGYYKDISNLFISEWTSFPRFSSRLQRAQGVVAGLDARLEIRRPNFYGYLNYGLSSVEYESQQETLSLWYGVESLKFRPPHDRRHQLNVLGNATLFGTDFSIRWNFGSGRPYNRLFGFDGFMLLNGAIDIFGDVDEQRVIYERPFLGRLPTYHRLDVSVERKFEFDAATLTLQGSVINVYDRRNIFALDTFTDKRFDQLPLIPTVGLKVEVR